MPLRTTGRWASCACPSAQLLTRFRRAASRTGCLQTLLEWSAPAAEAGDSLDLVACRMNETGEGEDMISDWTEVAETFDSMGLHENLLRGIYAYGVTQTHQLLQDRGLEASALAAGRPHLLTKVSPAQVSRSRLRSSRGGSCRSAAATT